MIGRECKCGNAFSLAILIDRGLDLENEYLVLHYLVLRLQLPKKNPVTITWRKHPFPSRTRKLSSMVPKILGGRPPGKIGSCRVGILNKRESEPHSLFFCGFIRKLFCDFVKALKMCICAGHRVFVKSGLKKGGLN